MKIIKYPPLLVLYLKAAAIITPIVWLLLMICLIPGNIIVAIVTAGVTAFAMNYFRLYVEKWSIEFDESRFTVHNMNKVTEANYSDIEKIEVRSTDKTNPEFSKEVTVSLKNDPKNVLKFTLHKNKADEMEFLDLLISKTS